MELILILLCTSAGTLIGTSVAVYLMQRKTKPPITDAELATLNGRLQSTESSLAAANTALESLRKQAAENEQKTTLHEEDLKNKQQQLELAAAEVAKEVEKRNEVEQKIQDLTLHAASLTAQRAELEARIKEERDRSAETASQFAALQEQRESDQQQIQKLSEQVERLSEENGELRQVREEDGRIRAALDTRMAELQRQITDLENERSQFDTRLDEERRSAAKGMELLLMAQENFSRVLKPRAAETSNGENGHAIAPALAD
ncbi:MAG: hypothetical protein C5B51_18100 [Terriglobia bacterium]|nr:MAG: hypothetical protein C5B51_18100 [Terriglobia bacterium]